jgi:ankyrin repeat protein
MKYLKTYEDKYNNYSHDIFKYIAEDNLKMVKKLIEGGLDINIKNRKGSTPLIIAAAKNKQKIFNYLIDKGADISIRNDVGTSIFNVINKEMYNKIKESPFFISHNYPLLLFVKFDDLELTKHNINKLTPDILIETLIRKNYISIDMIDLLIENGIDVNFVSRNLTALKSAIMNSNLPIIKKLIEYGADVNFVDPTNNWSILHYATNTGLEEHISLLIENGADVTKINNEGKTIFDMFKRIWRKNEMQRLVLENQPNAAYLLHKSIGIDEEFYDEFSYIIDSDELGII